MPFEATLKDLIVVISLITGNKLRDNSAFQKHQCNHLTLGIGGWLRFVIVHFSINLFGSYVWFENAM